MTRGLRPTLYASLLSEPILTTFDQKGVGCQNSQKSIFCMIPCGDVRILVFNSLLSVLSQPLDTFLNSAALMHRKYIEQRLKHDDSDISVVGSLKDAFLTSFDILTTFDHFYVTSIRCQNPRVCLIAFRPFSSCFPHCFLTPFDAFSDASAAFDHFTSFLHESDIFRTSFFLEKS